MVPIEYKFTFESGKQVSFAVDLSRDSSPADPPGDIPAWIQLSHHRCAHCDIQEDSRKTCPAALALRPVVEAFSEHISFEDIHVQVRYPSGRQQLQLESQMPAQYAVRSLVGLLLALSQCPVMEKLKPMARHHLPLGDREQTVFRFMGSYLIAQFLRSQQGQLPDWDMKGFFQHMRVIHKTNEQLAARIREASRNDAAVNSLIFLDTSAYLVEDAASKAVEHMLPLFEMYLD